MGPLGTGSVVTRSAVSALSARCGEPAGSLPAGHATARRGLGTPSYREHPRAASRTPSRSTPVTRSSSRRPSRSRGAGRDRGRASQRRRRQGAARLRARPARGPRGTRVRSSSTGTAGPTCDGCPGCTPTPRARIRAPTTREPHEHGSAVHLTRQAGHPAPLSSAPHPPGVRRRPLGPGSPQPGRTGREPPRLASAAMSTTTGNPSRGAAIAPSDEAYAAWRAAVAKVLAKPRKVPPGDLGAEPEQLLATTTYDDVVLAPLYTGRDELPEPPLPGRPPFVRGRTASRDVTLGWHVAVRHGHTPAPAEDVNEALLTDLTSGATALWLTVGGTRPWASWCRCSQEYTSTSCRWCWTRAPRSPRPRPCCSRGPPMPTTPAPSTSVSEPTRTPRCCATGPGDPARVSTRRWRSHSSPTAARWLRRAGRCGPCSSTARCCTTPARATRRRSGRPSRPGWATSAPFVDAGFSVPSALRHIDFRFAVTDDQFLTHRQAPRRPPALGAGRRRAAARRTRGGMRQHAVTSAAMMTAARPVGEPAAHHGRRLRRRRRRRRRGHRAAVRRRAPRWCADAFGALGPASPATPSRCCWRSRTSAG